jgi:hypothetical protein
MCFFAIKVEWERQEVTGDVPEPRMGAAMGMIDGEVVVAGGCNKQQPPRCAATHLNIIASHYNMHTHVYLSI